MSAAQPGVWPLLAGGLLIVWMLLRRLRSTVGAQVLGAGGRRRLTARSTVLGVLLLLTLAAPHNAASYGAGAAGLLIGALLAWWSLRHTRFDYDTAGQAVRYLPNVWIGSAVFGLFVVRLLWRLVPLLLGGASLTSAGGPPDFSSFTSGSPLTFALFAVFVAYQIAYTIGVLRRARGETV